MPETRRGNRVVISNNSNDHAIDSDTQRDGVALALRQFERGELTIYPGHGLEGPLFSILGRAIEVIPADNAGTAHGNTVVGVPSRRGQDVEGAIGQHTGRLGGVTAVEVAVHEHAAEVVDGNALGFEAAVERRLDAVGIPAHRKRLRGIRLADRARDHIGGVDA